MVMPSVLTTMITSVCPRPLKKQDRAVSSSNGSVPQHKMR